VSGTLQAPALLGEGLRPFFLAGAAWSAGVVGLWGAVIAGQAHTPGALAPVTWHAHELLFGYAGAVLAGFLLTALPNWTGREPVSGLRLLCIVLLWLAGRIAVAGSDVFGLLPSLAVALAFPVALLGIALTEVLAAGNHRNLVVAALLAVYTAGQAVCMLEAATTGVVYGTRIGLAAVIMLILLIGGRITPAFTGNWLKARGSPVSPAGTSRLDSISLLACALALCGWVAGAASGPTTVTGALALAAGALQILRQARWAPMAVIREPLLLVLHGGLALAAFGFVAWGAAAFLDMPRAAAAATHLWSVGAVGLMTLGVMTRATRGHTGRSLRAPPSTVVLYVAVLIAALARIAALYLPAQTAVLLSVAAASWVIAFTGFVLAYGWMLSTSRARDAAGGADRA
jgi:uncharacterized protein involved in response to NO